MNQHNRQLGPRPARRGFTLVEMLVSTALVVLMMLMFAQVFSIVTNTVSAQKGIAENDQKARTLINIVKGDLNSRTFKDIKPFWPGQTTSGIPEREGYFSISENDPNNPTDDVLQFTIKTDGDDVLFGNTVELGAIDLSNNSVDQPEFDDGVVSANGVGASTCAEISYFLRNGNLYRSVMLVRDEYDPKGTLVGQPKLPSDPSTPYIDDHDGNSVVSYLNDPAAISAPASDLPSGTYTGYFWRDFGFSAFYDPSGGTAVKFHNLDSLTNSDTGGAGTVPIGSVSVPVALGVPHLRYGSSLPPSGATSGAPREFLIPSTNKGKFLGRFLKQEIADDGFLYPGEQTTAANSPYTRNDLADANNDYIVDEYDDAPERRGAELLMTNVSEFDIRVFDDHPSVGRFVNLNDGSSGFYGTAFDPSDPTITAITTLETSLSSDFTVSDHDNRYDTWHPGMDNAGNPIDGVGVPPFAPYANLSTGVYFDRTVETNAALEDEDGIDGDEIALKAIQIRVVYQDPVSGQTKQVTYTHSLVN
ncbi:prepilin-type N-terminal cleavage/methylation domain-containing protein [Calycomorphotria hydatis]|uniref:Uncharacterized protein n=1 Tax=Calycomorphotria hydatis TaxID=2528027 RepID=A0A517T5U2_9PLAN|nr:prepilin-type N-terminal cleavage/methylation domain-containing protein [Calycomorphotria hydatis]QDT63756.1 hypothetical protein V22_09810 [Calycomorphotria hydatis]